MEKLIRNLAEVMLYVNDQEETMRFWTEKFGFIVLEDETNEYGLRWIVLTPNEQAETKIVLHNKEMIAKMQPELNVETPSLMFNTENIDEMYKDFQDKGITVGEMVTMPYGKVFNFADNEENYFAVMENI